MGEFDVPRDPRRDANPQSQYQPAIDDYARSLIERLRRNQRDEDALRLLSTHYESNCDYPSLANLLEGWARTLRDDQRASAAFVSAGDAVLDGKLDKNRARGLYEAAIDRYPESDEALDRLETLLRRLSDDTGHERVLTRMARALERRRADTPRRAAVHYRLGQLYEHRLRLPGKAISEYRTAVELDPLLVPAITAARSIYSAAGKHAAVADMYELEVSTVDDAEVRHDLLVALAAHQRDFLEDLDAAVRAVRRAIKAVPGRTATLELLADLLTRRAQHLDGDGARAEQADQAAHASDSETAETPQAEVDRRRAAELYYQVARCVPRGEAAGRLETCLALVPDHPQAQRMLDELMGYRPSAAGQLAPAVAPIDADLSQAEIDHRHTGRFAAAGEDDVTQPRAASPASDSGRLGSATDWLDDDAVELLDEEVTSAAMVPVTERPPPPARNRPSDRPPAPALAAALTTPPRRRPPRTSTSTSAQLPAQLPSQLPSQPDARMAAQAVPRADASDTGRHTPAPG